MTVYRIEKTVKLLTMNVSLLQNVYVLGSFWGPQTFKIELVCGGAEAENDQMAKHKVNVIGKLLCRSHGHSQRLCINTGSIL